jgi:hypothetical protein
LPGVAGKVSEGEKLIAADQRANPIHVEVDQEPGLAFLPQTHLWPNALKPIGGLRVQDRRSGTRTPRTGWYSSRPSFCPVREQDFGFPVKRF